MLDAVVDAGVQSESEPVSRCVDGIDNRIDALRGKARDVQHRPEDFFAERPDAVDPQHGRRHEPARGRHSRALQQPAFPFGAIAIGIHAIPRLVVDDRSDVGGEMPWIADAKLVDRTEQHLENPFFDLALDVENPQG